MRLTGHCRGADYKHDPDGEHRARKRENPGEDSHGHENGEKSEIDPPGMRLGNRSRRHNLPDEYLRSNNDAHDRYFQAVYPPVTQKRVIKFL
jgi:hypothetical protein